jgi:hypothetical protein
LTSISVPPQNGREKIALWNVRAAAPLKLEGTDLLRILELDGSCIRGFGGDGDAEILHLVGTWDYDMSDILPGLALLAILATGLGRVLYQRALTITDNNNGFVSVFFLLIPAFTCLLFLGLSPWIKELK